VSDDLAAFLSARLEEAEALARAAGGRAWRQGDPERTPGWIQDDSGSLDSIVVYDEGAPTAAQAAHIALNDPARVLREVAAGRRLLACWHEQDGRRSNSAEDEARAWLLDSLLADRAAVWSDHPDYQEQRMP
jgi:hypothetical protein